MTSVRGCSYPHQERFSVIPLFVTSFDSFSPFKLGDKLSDQLARPPRIKPPVANASITATSIPKYSKDNLQRILKAVLEVRTLAPALALALATSAEPQNKLKAFAPDVYCEKFHMDCYNFYQQCEDYFATVRATGPTQILFAAFCFQNRISFCWQQYK